MPSVAKTLNIAHAFFTCLTASAVRPRVDVSLPVDSQENHLPERVLWFGTGVLLRWLPDYLIAKPVDWGIFNGRIIVVKSTDGAEEHVPKVLSFHQADENEAIQERFPHCRVVANTFRFDAPPTGLRYHTTLYVDGQQYVSSELFTESVVDRVGSGDCFRAGLL